MESEKFDEGLSKRNKSVFSLEGPIKVLCRKCLDIERIGAERFHHTIQLQAWMKTLLYPQRLSRMTDQRFPELIHRPSLGLTSERSCQLILVGSPNFCENVVTFHHHYLSIGC